MFLCVLTKNSSLEKREEHFAYAQKKGVKVGSEAIVDLIEGYIMWRLDGNKDPLKNEDSLGEFIDWFVEIEGLSYNLRALGKGWKMKDKKEILRDFVAGLKSAAKVEDRGAQFYHDMEWRLLIGLIRDPEIIPEISKIISHPRILKGYTNDTAHSLLFQALTNIHDDGRELHAESLYAECEKLRELNSMINSYTRDAVIELNFTIKPNMDYDKNRVRTKFCAEQVLRRK